MRPVVVDSSGWIEYLSGSAKSNKYAIYLAKPDHIIVPTLVLFEVYRKIKKTRGEDEALLITTQMRNCRVTVLDESIAFAAADLSLKHELASADAFVYATAMAHDAQLLTSDNDFRGLPGVTVI